MYRMKGEFLLPCPLCANIGVAVTAPPMRCGTRFMVYCGLCSAYVERAVIGHVNKTKLRRCAVNAWNHRAHIGKRKNASGLIACPLCGRLDAQIKREVRIECRCQFAIDPVPIGLWNTIEPDELTAKWNRREGHIDRILRYGVTPSRRN